MSTAVQQQSPQAEIEISPAEKGIPPYKTPLGLALLVTAGITCATLIGCSPKSAAVSEPTLSPGQVFVIQRTAEAERNKLEAQSNATAQAELNKILTPRPTKEAVDESDREPQEPSYEQQEVAHQLYDILHSEPYNRPDKEYSRAVIEEKRLIPNAYLRNDPKEPVSLVFPLFGDYKILDPENVPILRNLTLVSNNPGVDTRILVKGAFLAMGTELPDVKFLIKTNVIERDSSQRKTRETVYRWIPIPASRFTENGVQLINDKMPIDGTVWACQSREMVEYDTHGAPVMGSSSTYIQWVGVHEGD